MGRLPAETHLGRVDLAVGDIDTVESFYREVVGFEPVERHDRHVDLGVGDSSLLRLEKRPELDPRRETQAGLFHIAVLVPDRETLARAHRRLSGSGRMTGASDHLVSEALYGRDPEGNGIEIYADRPRTHWEETADGGIRLVTWPLDLDDLDSLIDDADPDTSLPPETTIGHLHLEPTDLDRAGRFYLDTLGFDETFRMPKALFASAGGYHHHLGLNVWNNRRDTAGGRGLARYTIRVPDGASVDAVAERVAETPIGESRVVSVDDGERCVIRDADDIELVVVSADAPLAGGSSDE